MHTIYHDTGSPKNAGTVLTNEGGSFSASLCYQGIKRELAMWYSRGRQRHALAQLEEHLLRDIGVNRYDAAREAEKPFWRD